MDFLLQFDPVHRVLLITFGRVLTKASALAVHEAAERVVAAHGPCSAIADFSVTVKSELSQQFLRSLAAMSPAIPAGNRKILVAPTTATYGLSRVFQVLQERAADTIPIVHSLDEALRLLGIESPEFRTFDSTWPGAGMAAQ